jgi:Flp pilus assembly protein TadG
MSRVRFLQFIDGVVTETPTVSTGQKAVIDDTTGWNGSQTTVTYTVSSYVDDARKAVWELYYLDGTTYHRIVGGDIDAISATQVRVTFGIAPTSGTYRLVGLY